MKILYQLSMILTQNSDRIGYITGKDVKRRVGNIFYGGNLIFCLAGFRIFHNATFNRDGFSNNYLTTRITTAAVETVVRLLASGQVPGSTIYLQTILKRLVTLHVRITGSFFVES